MKAVPILALTNAVALGLVFMLYFQQEDLKSQIGSSRASSPSRTSSGTTASELALQERLDRLERRLENRELTAAGPARVAAESTGTDAPGMPPREGNAFPARESGSENANDGDALPTADSYDPVELEHFRRKVSIANDLNAKEERVRRVVDDLDRLVAESKIGALTDKQKKIVASVILGAREQAPTIWNRVRRFDLQNTPREEMGQIIRAEYETLRTETQKALEETMPAVDAKAVVEESLRDRSGFGFGGGDRGATAGRAGGRPNRGDQGEGGGR